VRSCLYEAARWSIWGSQWGLKVVFTAFFRLAKSPEIPESEINANNADPEEVLNSEGA